MKKLLSMILVLAMLCTALALASCGDDTTDTSSSEATSSEESVAPPTKAELLESAIESFDAYLTPFEEVLSIDTEKFASETGNATVSISVDELSAMGESMFGEDPLKIGMDMTIGGEATKAESILYAAGDEIKFDLYQKDGKQYVIFPELYADTVFDYADIAGTTDVETEPSDAEMPSMTAVIDEIKNLLLKEENITISEDNKIYTVTLGKTDVDTLLDLVGSFAGMTEGMDDIVDIGDISDTSEESTEASVPDSAVVVLNLASETQASCSVTFAEGENELSKVDVTCSVLSGMTSVAVKATAYDAEVLDLTMSATETAVSVEGDMDMSGMQIAITLNAANENGTCTFDGTLSLTVDMSGMLLTIPFEIDGTVATEGETLSMALSLSASMEDMMDIGLSMEFDYTPAEVTVELPFDESDVAEYDATEFAAKMLEVYPNAALLLGGSAGTADSVFYTNEDYTTSLIFYGDGTAELAVKLLTYEQTDDTITFFKNGTAFYSVNYTTDGDGNYNLFGDVYETAQMDPDFGDYLYNIYKYYDDSTYLDFYLYGDNGAELAMCFFYDAEATDLVLTQPDGTTVTFELEMSEDGSTVTILGETLSQASNEY